MIIVITLKYSVVCIGNAGMKNWNTGESIRRQRNENKQQNIQHHFMACRFQNASDAEEVQTEKMIDQEL